MLRIHLCLLGCLASHAKSPPGVPASGGKDDRRGEKRRGVEKEEIVQKYVSFLYRHWHIEKEDCNKASRGAEGERRRGGEKGGKGENKDMCVFVCVCECVCVCVSVWRG